MPSNRRNGDLLILEKLSSIEVNLALNTQATQNQNDQLIKLNGKVAAHESRLQATESNAALMSSALASLQSQANDKTSKAGNWMEWFIKGAIVVGFGLLYYLLTHTGFPDFLN